MSDSKVVVSRTTPIEGTHLTELELQELWYQDMERANPSSNHRAIGRLFPRSRRDMIEYYTRMDLMNKAFQFTEESCPGHVASDHDSKVCARCGIHIDSLRPD